MLGPAQMRLVEQLLVHRDWIMAAVGAGTRGLQGIAEQGFCQADWRHHFNPGGSAEAVYRCVNVADEEGVEVARIVEALSIATARLFTEARAEGFVARVAEGWQFSWGRDRSWHTDPDHLGDLILTITLEGSCLIEVEDVEARSPHSAPPWVIAQANLGDSTGAYAIWGPSRECAEHQVVGGIDKRLSLTLRFASGQPPPPAPRSDWQANDKCEARYQAGELGAHRTRWYPGRIRRVDQRHERCDVAFDDGDEEDGVPWEFLRLPGAGVTISARERRAADRASR